MDIEAIGRFLAELRHEHNLTQEQLGEELGVTNKTVSRWENGDYFPPIDILFELSKKYHITINEILCGKRLNEEEYKEEAEKNLKTTLSQSSFTLLEKIKYFKKKWNRDHRFEIIAESILLLGMAILGLVFKKDYVVWIAFILTLAWSIQMRNRKSGYVEAMVYDGKALEEKKKSE